MRTEARLYTSIWDDDPDWTARTANAQWAYMMLMSQQDLEHHGGIALRIPRWTHLAIDMTEQVLGEAIAELAEHRFIVVDRDYGELFVRALVRQDRVYKQPNVLRSAADRLSQVRSPTILAAMHAELLRVDELPDLTENCRLIIKEMIEATAPGAPRPTRRPRHRPVKPSRRPSDQPSSDPTADPSTQDAEVPMGKSSANPPGKGARKRSLNGPGKPSSKGSTNRSADTTGEATAKAAAYRSPKPASATSAAAGAPDPTRPGDAAQASDPPGPDVSSADPGKTTPNPSDNPARKASPQPRPNPADEPEPVPSPAPPGQRAILAAWMRSTGARPLTPDLVSQVAQVLQEALLAGGSPQHAAAVLDRWQQEDGTDPARLASMIANATPPNAAATTPDTDAQAADAPSAGTAAPSRWALETLAAATMAITQPWLSTLTDPPTPEELEDIEYHISRALTDGYPPQHIAAHLTAWHASGSTDTWQLTDLIEGMADVSTPSDAATPPIPAVPTTRPPAPTSVEEWLATAKAQP